MVIMACSSLSVECSPHTNPVINTLSLTLQTTVGLSSSICFDYLLAYLKYLINMRCLHISYLQFENNSLVHNIAMDNENMCDLNSYHHTVLHLETLLNGVPSSWIWKVRIFSIGPLHMRWVGTIWLESWMTQAESVDWMMIYMKTSLEGPNNTNKATASDLTQVPPLHSDALIAIRACAGGAT